MAADKKPKTDDKKAEKKSEQKKPQDDKQKPKGKPQDDFKEETLVRIANYDIVGSKNVFVGLTKIKGVSWTLANATCLKLGLPKSKKISELSKDEIKKIEEFVKNPAVPDFMKNRRKDIETGMTKHLVGSELDIRKDFDIRRLKKIRSYKGMRHTLGQPVRGQSTRSHFRTKGRTAVGVRKGSSDKPAAPKAAKK
jgi:small subunit ribosomal protein S13